MKKYRVIKRTDKTVYAPMTTYIVQKFKWLPLRGWHWNDLPTQRKYGRPSLSYEYKDVEGAETMCLYLNGDGPRYDEKVITT